MRYLKHHTKLTLLERKLIALWTRKGEGLRECARRLGRDHSTIVRELKRNPVDGKKGEYEPLHAQAKAERRKEHAWRRKHPLKNKKVFAYVVDRLRAGWSPEQISGRLKWVEHPHDRSWHLGHETIYRFIYSSNPKAKELALWEYLRRKQKRRRKRSGRKAQRVRIPDRISIHQRPKEVNSRKKLGHWEGDTLVGKGRNHGVHTEYERLTSLTRLEKMADLTAWSSVVAQRKIFALLPPVARKSTTLDNGHEHVLHQTLQRDLGVKT